MNKEFILIEVKSNEEEKNMTIVSNFYNQTNSPYIDKYPFQLFYLSEKQCQQFNLTKNLTINNRILINSTEGEGYISFNQTYDKTNNYIHITEKKIYSFSIYNKTSFFICAENNLTYNIKIYTYFNI